MTRLLHRTIEHLRNSRLPSALSSTLNHVVSPDANTGRPSHRSPLTEKMTINSPHTRPPAHLRREPWHLVQTRHLCFLCAIFRRHRPNERVALARDDAEPPSRIRRTGASSSFVCASIPLPTTGAAAAWMRVVSTGSPKHLAAPLNCRTRS
jgi:hypothetical protein